MSYQPQCTLRTMAAGRAIAAMSGRAQQATARLAALGNSGPSPFNCREVVGFQLPGDDHCTANGLPNGVSCRATPGGLLCIPPCLVLRNFSGYSRRLA
jgi:hypothetical protein